MTCDALVDAEIECPSLDLSKVNDLFVIQVQGVSVRIYINKYDFDYALRYLECKDMKNDRWCDFE